MKPYFADSWFFIALLNGADEDHLPITDFAAKLDRPLITTDWIVVEVADAFSSPSLRHLYVRLRASLNSPTWCTVLPARRQQVDLGSDLYSRRLDKAWSLTDCISFVVMAQRGLHDALTGDRHFEQAGFRALFAR